MDLIKMKGISNKNQGYVDCAIADLVQLRMVTKIFDNQTRAVDQVIELLQKFESD